MTNGKIYARRGISIIELLLVISLVLILGTMSAPVYTRFITRSQFDMTYTLLISSLEKAQTYTMAGRDDTVWGVCISGPMIRMFRTTCENPGISEEFAIPPSVSVTGLATVIFSKNRGEPDTPTTITVSNTQDTKTIRILQTGTIDYD